MLTSYRGCCCEYQRNNLQNTIQSFVVCRQDKCDLSRHHRLTSRQVCEFSGDNSGDGYPTHCTFEQCSVPSVLDQWLNICNIKVRSNSVRFYKDMISLTNNISESQSDDKICNNVNLLKLSKTILTDSYLCFRSTFTVERTEFLALNCSFS